MIPPNKIYLDYNATTPLHPVAEGRVIECFGTAGNPSSIHWAGQAAKALLREARENLAEVLHAHPLEFIFTSGASESNNTILRGIFDLLAGHDELRGKQEFVTSAVEHPSVLRTFQYLKTKGAIVHIVPVDRYGQLDMQFLRAHVNEKTALVSIMWANNETGAIHPIDEIATLCEDRDVLFHVDGVQALGKLPIDLKNSKVDYMTFSAHKFYAMKGCGFIYVRSGSPFQSLIYGGGQERKRRGGTENILAISSLSAVVHALLREPRAFTDHIAAMTSVRNLLEERILTEISEVTLTTQKLACRLPNTSHFVIAGVDGESLLMALDLRGFAVSTGAACSSGNPEPSAALLAMGLTLREAQSSLRVSHGHFTTEDEINSFVDHLKQVVHHLRSVKQEVRLCEKRASSLL